MAGSKTRTLAPRPPAPLPGAEAKADPVERLPISGKEAATAAPRSTSRRLGMTDTTLPGVVGGEGVRRPSGERRALSGRESTTPSAQRQCPALEGRTPPAAPAHVCADNKIR